MKLRLYRMCLCWASSSANLAMQVHVAPLSPGQEKEEEGIRFPGTNLFYSRAILKRRMRC